MQQVTQAKQLISQGDRKGARQSVLEAIRADPNNIDAWQLAVELSVSDSDRERAQAGLNRAKEALLSSQWPDPSTTIKPLVQRDVANIPSPNSGSEKFYFQDSSVHVTSTRVVIGSTTYSLSNITSVSVTKKPPSYNLSFLLLIGGGISACIATFFLLVDDSRAMGIMCLIPAILVILFGGLLFFVAKPTYYVVLGSASGERIALGQKDQEYIAKIANAINTAIIERG